VHMPGVCSIGSVHCPPRRPVRSLTIRKVLTSSD